MKSTSISVIIPTYKPGEEFAKTLQALKKQTHPIQEIIIMNTEKAYWDKKWEESTANLVVYHLTRAEFDHGATRDAAAKKSKGEIMVFMTQDALPAHDTLMEELVKALENEKIGTAYARQLPNPSCKIMERYTRSFNYPDKSSVKSMADLPVLGIKTFFCSNVCAAYKRDVYEKVGGFTTHTIFNEDMIYAGHMMQAGYEVAYAAKAEVIHSHNYGNITQFKRNFDLAVSQTDHPEVFAQVHSESEGMRLVKCTAGYLISIHKPWLLVELVIKSGAKFLGYRMGKRYANLPQWVIRTCTMNPTYWKFL